MEPVPIFPRRPRELPQPCHSSGTSEGANDGTESSAECNVAPLDRPPSAHTQPQRSGCCSVYGKKAPQKNEDTAAPQALAGARRCNHGRGRGIGEWGVQQASGSIKKLGIPDFLGVLPGRHIRPSCGANGPEYCFFLRPNDHLLRPGSELYGQLPVKCTPFTSNLRAIARRLLVIARRLPDCLMSRYDPVFFRRRKKHHRRKKTTPGGDLGCPGRGLGVQQASESIKISISDFLGVAPERHIRPSCFGAGWGVQAPYPILMGCQRAWEPLSWRPNGHLWQPDGTGQPPGHSTVALELHYVSGFVSSIWNPTCALGSNRPRCAWTRPLAGTKGGGDPIAFIDRHMHKKTVHLHHERHAESIACGQLPPGAVALACNVKKLAPVSPRSP
eukprot:gene13109-biopygen21538